MRTKSKWIINLVYTLLTVCWYINIVLACVGLGALILNFTTNTYTTQGIEVKRKGKPDAKALESLSPDVKSVWAEADQANIKMRLKVTAPLIIEAFGFFFAIEAIIMLVIFYLRKIFAAFKSDEPFRYEVVGWLRIVAICLVLTLPLKVVWGIVDYNLLTGTVKNFNQEFMLIRTENFMGIIIGILLYVVAETYRYGIQLKQENEAFV